MSDNNKKSVLSVSREAGFSLMEVLLSIFILVVALMGILTLIQAATSAGRVSSTELTAANLAQEGVEIVRNFRDASFVSGSWDGWYNSFSGTNNYLVQYDDTAFRAWRDITLKHNSVSGLYGYDAGVDTPYNYKRTVTLVKNPGGADDKEIKVSVLVTWTEKARAHSIMVEDRLWNWR